MDNEIEITIDKFHSLLTKEINLLLFKSGVEETQGIDEISNFLLLPLSRCRVYALKTEQHISSIWEEIRYSSQLTDFVLNLTCQFKTIIGVDKFNNLIEILSKSYAKDAISPGSSVMDTDTNSRLPTSSDIKTNLESNSWLIIIYLIPFLYIDDILEPIITISNKKPINK